MHDAKKISEIAAHNEIKIVPAQGGGFVVLRRHGNGFIEEMIAAVSTVSELKDVVGLIYQTEANVHEDPDFAEIAAPSPFEPLPAAFPIATKKPGGKSYRSAAADVIIAVPSEEGEREYGFLDEVAGNTAYTMLHIAGVNARITKSKDGFVGEPVPDHLEAVEEATDGAVMTYVVKTGTREDEEQAVTVFYDEEVAKRVCEIVWAAGGSAQMRPAKLI